MLNRLLALVRQAEYRAVLLVAFLVPIVACYANVNLPGWGLTGAVLTVAFGLAMFGFLHFLTGRTGPLLDDAWPSRGTPYYIVGGGLLLHVAIAAITAPQPTSDGLAYLQLAQRMASHGVFQDTKGLRAFWPVGLPLYLLPYVWVFGASVTAIAIANAVTYVLGSWGLWRLASAVAGRQVAAVALVLFALWPSRALLAGVAAKELLCTTLVTVALGLAASFFATPDRSGRWQPFVSGLALGWAALAQPGLLLIFPLMVLMFRTQLLAMGWKRSMLPLALLALGGTIVVTPWMIRNCQVFEGQFCGIATNGGSVFYRANNPLATGLWIENGAVPLGDLPELEQNRLGFELGKQWIRENPTKALKLSARKLQHYLSGDEHGAYWGIKRGDGLKDDGGPTTRDSRRDLTYAIATYVSLAFWLLMFAFVFRGVRNLWEQSREDFDRAAPLFYPMLYGTVVFSVFESGNRQHMFAVPALMVIASAALRRRSRKGLPAG